jgi:dephospho-CoA kinase
MGLTGGIGSGKSTFAAMLADLGAVVIDADALARQALAPGSPLVAEVAAMYPDVVDEGVIDRGALAAHVFTDAQAKAWLEGLVHPEVARLAAHARQAAGPDSLVVYDTPLLVEKGTAGDFDVVVVVEAPLEDRLSRLEQRGLSRPDALARMAVQATDDERAAVADLVVSNGGSRADLQQQAAAVFEAFGT